MLRPEDVSSRDWFRRERLNVPRNGSPEETASSSRKVCGREEGFVRSIKNVYRIDLPPLRERKDDIPLLVQHFLNKFCTVTNRPVPQVSSEAMELLTNHDWPGNVRELEDAVERALAVGRGGEVKPADFSFQFQPLEGGTGKTLDDVERMLIERILRETERNLSKSLRIIRPLTTIRGKDRDPSQSRAGVRGSALLTARRAGLPAEASDREHEAPEMVVV